MIVLEHLCVGYGHQTVLTDLSLTFPDGGITVLLGPNGCGKSTLLKTAAGLLKAQSGGVRVDGQRIEAYSGTELAKKIAYLPQTRALPSITVERMVLHGRFPYLGYPRRYRPEDYASAHRAMDAVGITELAQRDMAALSGGERQKVYIAMALAQDTPIILLDEPTTYLDIDHQLEVMNLALLLKEQGKSVLMVLHDLNLAFRFADQLFLFCKGSLVYSGTPQQFCDTDALMEVFNVRAHRVEIPNAPAQYLFYK